MKYFKRQLKRLRYRYDLLTDKEKKSLKMDILECIGCAFMMAAVIAIMILSILLENS